MLFGLVLPVGALEVPKETILEAVKPDMIQEQNPSASSGQAGFNRVTFCVSITLEAEMPDII